MTDERAIQKYQSRCFSDYKESVGINGAYNYLYGNPVNVLVPVEVAVGGVLVVGAYPSAKFFTVAGVADTPLYDNDAPFSSESYFDGSRTRSIPSGTELNEKYLKPLGIRREQCWITDLVKVFLFKEGHVRRYEKLGKKTKETRSRFDEIAAMSLPWLAEEIRLAQPQVVITLGEEVASFVCGAKRSAVQKLMDGTARRISAAGTEVSVICLPHPGIIMKPSPRNPWPERFEKVIIPQAAGELRRILRDGVLLNA